MTRAWQATAMAEQAAPPCHARPLPQVLARVAEHAHPRPVFAPGLRRIRILHTAEYTLGVRHHHGEAAVRRGVAVQATGRAVRVEGISLGRLAMVVDVADDGDRLRRIALL